MTDKHRHTSELAAESTKNRNDLSCSGEQCSCSTATASPFRRRGAAEPGTDAAGTNSGTAAPDAPGNGAAGDNPAAPGDRDAGADRARSLQQLARIAGSLALLGVAWFAGDTLLHAARIAVYLGAYLLVAWPVLRAAVGNILHGRVFDEMFLMTVATLGAFAIGEFAEAVAVMLFYTVGEYFQDLAVGRSRRSIAALTDLRPDTARVLNAADGSTQVVSPEEVAVGQLIEVLPGERIPLDGIVVSGEGGVDTSALTGESVPRMVEPEDDVAAGYITEGGRLRVRVTRPFGRSSIARVIELAQHAAERKAPTERFISRFARVYTPIVVAIAAAVAILPPLVLPGAEFSEWLYRALVVLVISCPCALVVSIPLSYFGGIGGASRRRVLVKGATYLDALTELDTVVFDKTGTLTKGVFTVTAVEPRNGFAPEELLRLAAQAESGSTHPIARAVVAAYIERYGELELSELNELREEKGFGVFARLGEASVIAGNHRLMHREEIPHTDCEVTGTTVYLAVDGRYAGYLVVSDELKPEARTAIAKLKRLGIERIVMLTGDNRRIAESVAHELGIAEVYAELLPEDKVALLEELQEDRAAGGRVAFVGDGINDAPVLMRADIGIAMGGLGSDAAIEAADVVLMDDGVDRVPAAVEVGRRTRAVVRQNIAFTLGAKAVFIALGALGVAGMWLAVIGDMGVALLAVFNATRTLRVGRDESHGRRPAKRR